MRRTLPTATPVTLLTLLNQPDTLIAALAGAGAGNVENGTHVYGVSFVTAIGESEVSEISLAVTVADKTANGQVALSGIPKGPAGTTARKVYRSVANAIALKLHSTIANNTATTATDNTADAGLGASPKSVDYSGLPMIRGFYEDLKINVADTGNTVRVYVDNDNPNISATNFGAALLPGGPNEINFRGGDDGGRVRAGNIWLFTTIAGQTININGQEV